MKKDKLIFWIATSVIIFVEGIGNVATVNQQYAKDIVYNLGYPEYFRVAMSVFKLVGVLILITPKIPLWVKEWAYAGFFINTAFAVISYWSVYGWGSDLAFPFFVLASLLVSYHYHKKISNQTEIKIS
ncbi:DoxX-like family protein [Reichenbachiella faecimaris]|uniref:DoxX-like family protein n=1 Tax=Reichenbachiella faecimaris TaxID=692418 RepID=A0A1W2GN54_REIFA|nr:DoxX family protein [Reichenbachiella faecimaris]SMD37686.1 DoxX-like family protein [Reichenbachiella faecimaris]